MKKINHLSTKSQLQLILLLVSFSSIFIVGYLGLTWARESLKTQIFNQLTSVRNSKAYQIEFYLQTLHHHLETLSEDRMVVEAMMEFNQAFQEINQQPIPIDWDNQIISFYQQEFFPRLSKSFVQEPNLSTNKPSSNAARYLQYNYLANNPYPVGKKDQLLAAQDGSRYSNIHGKYHKLFQNLIKKFGYYDFFLIDPNTSDIVYTVYKETDFGANLNTGILAKSNFAQLVNRVRKNPHQGVVQIVDFQPYQPSYMAPAAFIAAPIYNGEKLVGILAVQLPIDQIDRVLTSNKNWKNDGLGNTGETYMVGADLLMRSNSRLLLEDAAAYTNVLKSQGISDKTIRLIEQLKTSIFLQQVNTAAAKLAIKKQSGTLIINQNYQNKTVLSSYAPLNIEGVNWAIISEINLAEAYQQIYNLQRLLLMAAVILALIVAILANVIANKFVKPIEELVKVSTTIANSNYSIEQSQENNEIIKLQTAFNTVAHKISELVNIAQKIASGNLTTPIQLAEIEDEIGKLQNAFYSMNKDLNSLILSIQNSGVTITTSSTQIAASGKQLAATFTEQLASTNEVTATAQEIATTSRNLVNMINKVEDITNMTSTAASQSRDELQKMKITMQQLLEATNSLTSKLDVMNKKASNINNIVLTINKFATQTDSLSLNAAIEAEKAGQYGAGFAVVAGEIRRLANQTGIATLEIDQIVQDMQTAVAIGVMEMDKFTNSVHNSVKQVNLINNQMSKVINQVESLPPQFEEVSDRVQEQSQGAIQISEAMAQISEASEQTVDALRETNYALEELAAAAQLLKTEISRFQVSENR
ncbi:methyl-accepting chemotaxis protein [Sphaerospermopsis aphanizomenoides]|uniref:methyl-accepting chemotaxis protein n=1 Tax=Sphaerospermopsis aphanizomenoides TaxID=459663 RepID=UPI001F3E43B6|nr:methyl-accepting chemotaxis protein [Sphaerospermopsis aphanizomenoides]